ncbi:MAG: non-canonical purine NTP pyrophosphatase [Candidatus Levybacteria bacterium]|nr:non-canonical purine NTP pyrophosphatase [Candidatus Levybacteria bacterium]
MVERITFLSSNQNKAAQIGRYLHVPVDYANLSIPEIQSLDPREVAAQKAIEAYRKLQKPVLVDDSSLVFSA